MKNKVWIIVLFLAIVGGGTAYLLMNDSKGLDNMANQTASTVNQQAEESSTTVQPSAPDTATPGKYIDYNQDVIAQTSGTKILFFHAPWCPQCRALEADIQEKGVPSGVTIIKVDYDSNQSLRQKYGVTIQTSLVKIDDQANLVEKFVAYNDPSVASIIENLL